MKNISRAAMLALALAACSQAQKPVMRLVDIEATLPDDYFGMHSNCIRQWRELVDEWRHNGGGFKGSMAATRLQVSTDTKSRLAALIRRGWATQTTGVPASSLGSWPVDRERLHASSAAFEQEISAEVADECKSVAWLDPLIWDELRDSGASERTPAPPAEPNVLRFDEVPRSLEWSTPAASHWTRYWLLQRIEE